MSLRRVHCPGGVHLARVPPGLLQDLGHAQMVQVLLLPLLLLSAVPAAQANSGDPYVNEAPLGPGAHGSSLTLLDSL